MNAHFASLDRGDIIVLQIQNPVGVLDDGGGVTGKEVLDGVLFGGRADLGSVALPGVHAEEGGLAASRVGLGHGLGGGGIVIAGRRKLDLFYIGTCLLYTSPSPRD